MNCNDAVCWYTSRYEGLSILGSHLSLVLLISRHLWQCQYSTRRGTHAYPATKKKSTSHFSFCRLYHICAPFASRTAILESLIWQVPSFETQACHNRTLSSQVISHILRQHQHHRQITLLSSPTTVTCEESSILTERKLTSSSFANNSAVTCKYEHIHRSRACCSATSDLRARVFS
jgi:hypothetical protein